MKKTLFESIGDAIILILLIPFILAFLFLISILKTDRRYGLKREQSNVFDDEEISWRMRGQI